MHLLVDAAALNLPSSPFNPRLMVTAHDAAESDEVAAPSAAASVAIDAILDKMLTRIVNRCLMAVGRETCLRNAFAK